MIGCVYGHNECPQIWTCLKQAWCHLLELVILVGTDCNKIMIQSMPQNASTGFLNFTESTGGNPCRVAGLENCWGSLKQYLCTTYKPKNVQELMDDGIEQFWLSLTHEIYAKYIQHLHKVMPK